MSPLVPRPSSKVCTDTRHVLVLEEGEGHGPALAPLLRQFNLAAKSLADRSRIEEAIDAYQPDVLVVDVAAWPGPETPIADITRLAVTRMLPPLVFVAPVADFATRLECVRAGGLAFFGRPVEIDRLVDSIEVLTAVRSDEPYRVLLVDDSLAAAAYHANLLREAGMVTRVVSDPLHILAVAEDFGPELVLIDTTRAACSRDELAAVLRQHDAYAGLPVVFIAAESEVGPRLGTDRLGGDGLLTKPVDPLHLIAAITLRARHHRQLRAMLQRDALTGLFNHSTTKQFLTTELLQVQRYGGRLAYTLIDIDHFGHINDSHGHPAGDRVIRGLAKLLSQRLRGSDIVGRHGGNSFAVVLTGTPGANARTVIDEIRDSFAGMHFFAGEHRLTATFSAGIVDADGFADAPSLGDAAQRMLAFAKQRGRNRCVLAGDEEELPEV